MRKIDKHRANLERYGERYCPRQFEAFNEYEMSQLVRQELERAGKVGLRTDWWPGTTPDKNLGLLPFHHVLRSFPKVMTAFYKIRQFPARLTILVCESVPPDVTKINFVANKIDDEHCLIEYCFDHCSQREMYDNHNQLLIGVGPSSYVYPKGFDGASYATPVRCYRPEEVRQFRFDEVHHFVCTDPSGELVGTVGYNGKLYFW